MLKTGLFQILIIIAAFGCFCIAVSAQDTKPIKRPSGSIRGETYSYKYTKDDFTETPSWNGEDGEPPLSMSRAVAISRANLPRFVTSAENFKMQHIMLKQTGNDKWAYMISFNCMSSDVCRELPTRQFLIIVKMDGTILEPKRIVEID